MQKLTGKPQKNYANLQKTGIQALQSANSELRNQMANLLAHIRLLRQIRSEMVSAFRKSIILNKEERPSCACLGSMMHSGHLGVLSFVHLFTKAEYRIDL